MSRPPHIVLLMADQLRADVLGAYGGSFGASPRLDRLSGESVVFERHLTNCPLCVPARIAQITGTWPHVHGAIVNAWDPGERPYGTCRNLPTFYEALAGAGYRVEHVGVDHLRCEPPLAGRHQRIRFSGNAAEHRQMLAERGRRIDVSATKSPCVDYECGRPVVRDYTNANTVPWTAPAEEFYDLWIADRAVEAVESADPAEPLALMAEFWSPHCPLSAPEPYFSMFDPAGLELPETVGRWYPGQSPMQLANLPGHVAAATTMEGWRRAWAVYLGMVRLLDDALGRVLDALERRGFLENALVVFTSDHGEMLGSHRMFQKMCMYEEAVRVPFWMRPPGGTGGAGKGRGRRAALTQHLDLAATLCDYAGVESPAASRGMSLRRLVEDPSAEGHREVFVEFNGNSGRSYQQRALVTPEWKYIHNHGHEPELYSRAADPLETRNLIQQEGGAPAEAAALRERLREWMASTGDCIGMD